MKHFRKNPFHPGFLASWALGLMGILTGPARAGLCTLEVYQAVEQIMGDTAKVGSPDNLNNSTQWTLGTSKARFIMKGLDAAGNPLIAGMEVKPANYTGPLGQGTNSLMIARTVDSQTVKDAGTISINLKAPSRYTLDLEFSFYDAPGGFCDWKTPRALPLMVSSFDIDFQQRYSFNTSDFLYLQTETGSPLVRSTAGDFTTLTGASAGTIPSDAKSGVYAITNGGSSFRLRLSHDATALFLLEFRDKPKIAPPVAPEIITLHPTASYGDRVWLDIDGNGMQNPGEPGVDGVRIDFYRDNGDGQTDPSKDSLVDSTFTKTVSGVSGSYLFKTARAGDYYALIWAPEVNGFTRPNEGGDDALDSDALPLTFQNRRAALLPLATLKPGAGDKMTQDAGLVDRSGIPAVWAIGTQKDGNIVLGGRFASSHGVARRNIARVTPSGAPDLSFDPGTGFNGTVRTIDIMKNGRILVGGDFTTYNGVPTGGFAVLSKTGKLRTGYPQPDRADVRWVGSVDNTLFVAGSFASIGGRLAGNFARLKCREEEDEDEDKDETDMVPDTSFDTRIGTNGPVFAGLVTASQKVVIAGAFTQYAGAPAGRIAMLLPDGKADPLFKTTPGANGEIYSVTGLPDGNIVLTGAFTSFNGLACNGVVKISPAGVPDPEFKRNSLDVKSINSSN